MHRRDFLERLAAIGASGAVLPHLDAATLAEGEALANRPADPFIERLIARMTLEEKAGQLNLLPDFSRPEGAAFNPAVFEQSQQQLARAIASGHVTGLFNGTGVAGARALQRIAVEQSRLKIPLIFGGDVIHGLRTIFPVPLAEAAAFDVALAERTARVAAVEATAVGIHWTFAPMVDIARDQRWGRVIEGAGEDPFLGSLLAAARVRGFQGSDLRRDDTMVATLKHFAGYGAVSGGMEYNTVELAETTLRALHLPPFFAGLSAGARTVMTAFNDIAGVPATANRRLLTDILRTEWGFTGVVVSDWASDEELISHGYAADAQDAARRSILAGCDMSMASGIYLKHLPALVRAGAVPMSVVDRSVRRVLQLKQSLGLFERPYRSMDPEREQTQIRTPSTVALAREAGARSIVLLKNDGDLLPLAPDDTRIALIGPFGADREQLAGAWSIFADRRHDVSLADGLRSAMRDPSRLSVVRGCEVNAPISGGVAAAVDAARQADVVLLAVGEAETMSGESQSRVDIGLPPAQLALADAVASTGKPVVVLLRHGRALAMHGAVADARAILATWFLGAETGNAVADVLFGRVAPSGRLPVSFPLYSGQQPYFYNHRPTGRPAANLTDPYRARYIETRNVARYPFGHGLTYGRIEYGATSVSASELPWAGRVVVRATVTNRGTRPAREVAQLYVHQPVSALTKPVRELKGFRAVTLEPGAAATVEFTLTRADLASVQPDLSTRAEVGIYEVVIAPNAEAGEFVRVRLRGP
jgi:beta-glucosidase